MAAGKELAIGEVNAATGRGAGSLEFSAGQDVDGLSGPVPKFSRRVLNDGVKSSFEQQV